MDGETDVNIEKVEEEAAKLGWTPLEKFKGNAEKWVDAQTFLERGEQVMPILRKTNARLKADLAERDTRIDNLETSLHNMQETIAALEKHHSAANKHAAEQAIENLKANLRQAREDGDVDREVEILEQIGIAKEAIKDLNKPKEEPKDDSKKTKDPAINPEIEAWTQENKDWFGPDKKKTRQFNRIAEDLDEELREAGERDDYTPRSFLEKCEEVWEEKFGKKDDDDEPVRRPTSKVESTTRGNSSTGSKGWNALPADAKRACMDDVDTFVGPGKKFQTVDEWKAYYVRIYTA